MAQPEHDDEIIEDYEVESSGPPEAAGGPVAPQGKPSAAEAGAAAAAKGKITHGQAKMIWIICIAVCVLGGAAVGVHYFFIAEKGGAGNGTQAANRAPAKAKQPPKELTEHEKNVNEYIVEVRTTVQDMRSSKAWAFFFARKMYFDYAMEQAREAKAGDDIPAREKAWLEVIKTYLDTMYAMDLLKFVNAPKTFVMPEGMDLPTGKGLHEGVTAFTEEMLKNPELRRMHAAALLVDDHRDDLVAFQRGPRSTDQICNAIWETRRQDFEGHYTRWQKGQAVPPEFEAADLEFVKGPDYKDGEQTEFEKAYDDIQKRKAEKAAAGGKKE